MKGSRPITPEEVSEVFVALQGARNRCFFVMGLNTGFRVSELLSLDVGDVYQHGRVTSAATVARRNMKGKSEGRTVPLNKKAREAVAEWLDELGTDDPKSPLFVSQRKWRGEYRRISRVQAWRVLRKACNQAAMTGKLGTHCMRKTFANRMYDLLDGRLVDLQAALGHKWVTSTSQYISFRQDAVHSAFDAL